MNEKNPETPAESEEELARARARRIMRAVTRKSVYFGGESREKVQRVRFPGSPYFEPRNHLVEALAAAVGDVGVNKSLVYSR